MENNIITGEKFEIIGRGTVFICENCTHDPGDTFLYQGKNYFIKGVELQGYEEKPYKKAGLLVVEVKEEDKTISDKFTIEKTLKETGGRYLSPYNTTKYMEKKDRIETKNTRRIMIEKLNIEEIKAIINVQHPMSKIQRITKDFIYYTFDIRWSNKGSRVGFEIKVPLKDIGDKSFYKNVETMEIIEWFTDSTIEYFKP